jgi:DNA-binding transcriptional LysR family regulator
MDLAQLEVFLTVAREGRFSRAAEKLRRTQSAISQSIRKLEQDLGEPLFDRSSREGRLTDAGRVLQEYAERLLNLRTDAREALSELRHLQQGKLAIAANEFTALYLLPILTEFRRLHPMVRIMVHRSLGSHIPDDVLRHTSELGVLSYDPQDRALHSIVVYLDELILVAPPSHPLAGEREVSIRQLGTESFVAHIVSSPYREKVIQAFQRHKTPLHMDIELPTLQAIKSFIALGTGMAFLPEISVKDELARGELVHIPVQELKLHRKLRLIYRRSASLSHTARAFLKVAQSIAVQSQGNYRFERDGADGRARRTASKARSGKIALASSEAAS